MRSIKNSAADAKDIAAAMAVVPNDGPSDWEYFSRVGMAIWAATEGNEDGCEIPRLVGAKPGARRRCSRRTLGALGRNPPPREIGAGSIFHWAREAQSDWRKPSDDYRVTAQNSRHTQNRYHPRHPMKLK